MNILNYPSITHPAKSPNLNIFLASKLPRLGKHRNDILSAHGAYTNPSFYNQIHKDIDELINLGRLALIDKFEIN